MYKSSYINHKIFISTLLINLLLFLRFDYLLIYASVLFKMTTGSKTLLLLIRGPLETDLFRVVESNSLEVEELIQPERRMVPVSDH